MILLDTNIVISLLLGTNLSVRQRHREAIKVGRPVAVSSITVFELQYGCAASQRRSENQERLFRFFAGPIATLAFEDEDARVAGEVRAQLKPSGTPIGPYDVLIAGQALRRDAMLVTANSREFERVRGLRLQDWSR